MKRGFEVSDEEAVRLRDEEAAVRPREKLAVRLRNAESVRLRLRRGRETTSEDSQRLYCQGMKRLRGR
jgi:hypothetical protein